ncbi:hypothetical protein MB46_06880 [Arthrobacter alpinus]|nr:hypothetical protein MB46_06880 [Arthrobacter alpinus]
MARSGSMRDFRETPAASANAFFNQVRLSHWWRIKAPAAAGLSMLLSNVMAPSLPQSIESPYGGFRIYGAGNGGGFGR